MRVGDRGFLFACLVAAAGGIVGSLVAGLAFGVALIVLNPQVPPDVVAAGILHGGYLVPPMSWVLMAGALGGFLIVGGSTGNRLVLGIMRGILMGFQLFIGVAVGALIGLVGYLALWITSNPEQPVRAALGQVALAIHDPVDPLRAFLTAGSLAGFVVALYVVGGQELRRWARAGTGIVVGGLAGLVIFTVGYVMVNYPQIPNSSDYVFHFAEAIYSFTPVELLFIAMGGTVGLLMARYSWKLYGVLTLIALVSVVAGYIAYTLTRTLPFVPAQTRLLSYLLFGAETLSLFMVLLYSFYSIDVATRKHWRRTPADAVYSPYFMPKVAIQVPVYNEPPEIVIPTLESLVGLDYPVDRFIILVLDDSTKPEYSQPIRAFCDEHAKDVQIRYQHRADRRGYKAGALNDGLAITPEDANILAIVDADYQVIPEFLRETVGFFVDPDLGWIQTPQDYRNQDQSFLTRQYYMADAYFYRAVLPSRNEENSIIFCGTMGLLRKQALLDVGGWGEKYITEDAELSLRLVNAGWKSLYVNKTYGRGLIPASFEGYKKQHYRWAFGGGKILRGHFVDFLFGRFTPRQRFDYVVGNLNWFEGVFILAISFAVLAMGMGELIGVPFVTHHANEVLLLGLIPWFFLVDGLTRVHMVLRRTMRMSFGATVRVLGMWFSIKFSDTFGAVKALLGFNMPFIRTAKAPSVQLRGIRGLKNAVLLTRFESTMSLLLLLTAAGVALRTWYFAQDPGGPMFTRILLLLWLVHYSLVFAAAPIYAYRSYATLKPDRAPVATPTGIKGVPT